MSESLSEGVTLGMIASGEIGRVLKVAAPSASDIDFERLRFAETLHWTYQIHENQSYLGRTVLLLKRETTSSLTACTEAEWRDLKEALLRWERFMSARFAPDRFNYAQLGNVYPRLHFHAVPRYSSSREWRGVTFVDNRWGKNWPPTPPSPLALADTYSLAEWIADAWKR